MVNLLGWLGRRGRGEAHEPLHKSNLSMDLDWHKMGWNNLPADVLDRIVSLMGAECTRTIGNLRLVCLTWKDNINTRISDLRIFRRPESPPTNLWRTFHNLQKVIIICSADLEDHGESEIWGDIRRLPYLRELNIVRCRGKLSSGAEHLCEMYRLETLWIDGPTLSHLAEKGSSLAKVSTLVVGQGSHLGNQVLKFLLRCEALHRLVILDAGGLGKESVEQIGKILHIQELALVGASADLDISQLTNLKKLVIRKGFSDHHIFEGVGGLSSLQSLSLSGCEVVHNEDWEQLNHLHGLEHLRLSGSSEVAMEVSVDQPGSVDSLSTLELFQCPSVDEDALRASLGCNTNLRLIQKPGETLEKIVKESKSTETIQTFLKSVQEPNMPEVPVSGEFFTTDMVTDLALEKRHDVIDLLVQYGADVDYGNPMLISTSVKDGNCSTPLHFAVHNKDKNWAQRLLDLGARANASCAQDLRTPLHLSIQWDDLDLVKLLLSSGADLKSIDEDLQTPLHYAVKWATAEVIKELVQRGADPTVQDFNMVNPIGFAAEQGNIEVMDLLLELGMDVNEGSRYNFSTPLHRASKVGDLAMVKYLVGKGADPQATMLDGSTPMMVAGQEGKRHVVEYFLKTLKLGPNELDMADDAGKTILHHAGRHGWVEVVEDLIQRNVQVNKGDTRGFTPLYYADTNRHLDVVHRLSRVGGVAYWMGRKKLYKYPWLMSCACGSHP